MNSLASQVFDIPEIQESIFGDLDLLPQIKARLMLVSHAWATMIRPFLWYHFDDSDDRTWVLIRSLTKEFVLNQAPRMRYLVVQTGSILSWLTELDPKVKNRWIELNLQQDFINNSLVLGDQFSEVDAMSILKGCSRLRVLSLSYFAHQQRRLFNFGHQKDLGFESSLLWPCQLRELNLLCVDLTDFALKMLTTFFPKLESLSLESLFLHRVSTLKTESTTVATTTTPSSSESSSPPPPPSEATTAFNDMTRNNDGRYSSWTGLRKLTMCAIWTFGHDRTNEYMLGELVLSQCRQLEHLNLTRAPYAGDQIFIDSVIQALGSFGQQRIQLSSLTLNDFKVDKKVDDMARLLETFTIFPKTLNIHSFNFRTASELALIDPERLRGLESIDLQQCEFEDSLTIQYILVNSPRLVSFKMDRHFVAQVSMLENSQEWACRGLEEFECYFTATAANDKWDSDTFKNHQQTLAKSAAVVKRGWSWYCLLFDQLGKLHKLKHLKLDLELPRYLGLDHAVVPLQMFKNLAAGGAVMDLIDIRQFFYSKYEKNESTMTVVSSAHVDWCRRIWPEVKIVEYEEQVVDWQLAIEVRENEVSS